VKLFNHIGVGAISLQYQRFKMSVNFKDNYTSNPTKLLFHTARLNEYYIEQSKPKNMFWFNDTSIVGRFF